jgi:type I restriction enzyme, S subunit
MTDWVPLGELGEIVAGSTPSTHIKQYWNGDIPWITPADLTNHKGIYFTGTLRKITKAGYNSCSTKMLPAGSILYSTRAPIGHCAVTAFPLCTNQGFKSIVPNERLNAEYGYYALRFLTPQIVALGRGATFGEVNKEIFENIQIPLPPLPEQQRIAALLDRADRLRRMRRYAQELSASFLQSVFVQMFGDPVNNSKRLPVCVLQEVARVERGKFTPRPRNDPSYYGGPFPFIQTGDISNSGGRLGTWTQTLNEKGTEVSRSFPAGTVLIAIVGATIGATTILEREMYCPDSIVGIQVHADHATSEYIEFLLRFWRPIFLAQAPETARANLNLDRIRPLKLPLPSLQSQQKFARIVQQHERLRAQQREATRQAEHLFQTLLHRAFNGEL